MARATRLAGWLCAAALFGAARLPAATVTHTTLPDFQTGLTTGAVAVLQEPDSPATGIKPGAVGVLPQPGAAILNDDFNYTNTADFEAAGWKFSTPNAEFYPELVDHPSSYSFPGGGALRVHASRGQDFWGTHVSGQDRPLIVMNNHELTGDFIAETKFTIQGSRDNPLRLHGIVVMAPAMDFSGNQLIDASTNWTAAAVQNTDTILQQKRYAPDGFGWEAAAGSYPSNTVWIRLVRQGAYFSSYFKTAEGDPWVFLQSFSMDPLKADASTPVIVGIVEKSWGAFAEDVRYQDTDYDYFKVNEVAATTSGTFSNVMDAGVKAAWQSISLVTQSMPGTKFQVRAGDTLAGGTLTDGGAFVGPDGTAGTFYEADVANVLPASFQGKRYLEYNLSLEAKTASLPGQNVFNLPAVVKSVTATYQVTGLASRFLADKADFGADTANVAVQPGDGDLGLKRTEVFRDEFNSDPLANGWTFTFRDLGAATQDVTSREGWLRMGVDYPEDIFIGDNDSGGVRLLRPIPNGLGDFEIETEVNVETQNSRMAGIYLWQDKDNFVGIAATRRDQGSRQIGVFDDYVIGNGLLVPDVQYTDYGSNRLFLRVTKQGQIITLSARDATSPAWRVHRVFNMAGKATGATDFAPTQIALMGKSYGATAPEIKYVDFNYVAVSTVAPTGAKDLAFTVPGGSKLDTLVPLVEVSGGISYQLKDAGGTYVGPDGTAGSAFSADQPKIPAALNALTNVDVRATFSNTSPAGTPYLHALGVQYADANTKIARDTNAADFTAGVNKNGVSLVTRPGTVLQEGVGLGAPVVTNFTSQPAGWAFSSEWVGKLDTDGDATVAYAAGTGATMTVGTPIDLWGGTNSTSKPRAVLYNATPVTGDFQLDTHINFPNGRTGNRHQGLAVVQALPGTGPDAVLDMANVFAFGPYQPDGMRFMRIDNGNPADGGPGGYLDNAYYLRVRKIGNTFTGYVSTDGVNYTQLDSYTFAHNFTDMYVGVQAKAWPGSVGNEVMEFDKFTYTPLSAGGSFESRVLDLGQTGLAPLVTQAGNSGNLQIQFRAADTTEGLSAATYTGPDGTANTSYSGSFNGLLANLSGKRYFQYKVVLPAGTLLNDIAVVGVNPSLVPNPGGDAMTVLKIAGGIQPASADDKTRLDANTDGKVDLLDAALLLRDANGL